MVTDFQRRTVVQIKYRVIKWEIYMYGCVIWFSIINENFNVGKGRDLKIDNNKSKINVSH